MANIYNKVEEIRIGEIVYGVMVVQHSDGRLRYINVRKLSQNPWLSMGKDYQSWDECLNKYKNENMKKALLEIKERYDLICVGSKKAVVKKAVVKKAVVKKSEKQNMDSVISLQYAVSQIKSNNVINC